jgi:hypothetical protein
MVFPSETVMGEPPSCNSPCADVARAEATSTEQHTNLANACSAMRLILRKKMIKKKQLAGKDVGSQPGDKHPNTSRLLVNEYINLSEIFEIGYVT